MPTKSSHQSLRVPNFIAGEEREARATEFRDVRDPATGDLVAQTPLSSDADVDEAVAAANTSFLEWAEIPVTERARVMFRLHALFEKSFDELAEIITVENGKAVSEAKAELRRGLDAIEFAAGMPTLMMGEVLEQVSRGVDTELVREPIGVCAAITSFNFPALIPLLTAPIAITAGNTYVLKPSQRTPLTANRIANLFTEAGVPAGVFNVVHGLEEVVEALCDHPDVAAISFVGSASVARSVYARAAQRGKRVQALAGAKNHIVVMPDADLDLAGPGVFSSAFANAGQRCLAGSVGVAIGGAGDELVSRLVNLTETALIGPGLQPDSFITPVTTEEARERIASYIDVGVREGATLIVDGRGVDSEEGYYLGPTILDDVHPDMRVAREEIFGPILAIERLDSLNEAIKAIESTGFGNASAIFTRDGRTARLFRRRVKAGMVGINVPVPAPVAMFPIAGWGGSFFGDLHALGKDGVHFFTESKVVTSRWEP